jgi:alkyl hydroperoxide reductase subunit AhpC
VVIGPDKRIKALIAYPMTTGRNFDEVLRRMDSLPLTATAGVATPVNWIPGDRVIIPPSVSNEEAKRLYPQGRESVARYLRFVRLSERVTPATTT